jgi:hypothetical protein
MCNRKVKQTVKHSVTKIQKKAEKQRLSTINLYKMTQIDLRTPTEIERDQRNDRICSMYSDLKKQDPEVSLHRCAVAIGEKEGVTPQTVKRVLTDAGLYTPTSND